MDIGKCRIVYGSVGWCRIIQRSVNGIALRSRDTDDECL